MLPLIVGSHEEKPAEDISPPEVDPEAIEDAELMSEEASPAENSKPA